MGLLSKKYKLKKVLKMIEKLVNYKDVKFYKEKFIDIRENINIRKNIYVLDWWTVNYIITLLIFTRNLLCKYRLVNPYFYSYYKEYNYLSKFIRDIEKYIMNRLPEEYDKTIKNMYYEFKINCECQGAHKNFLYYESSDAYREKILNRLMLFY